MYCNSHHQFGRGFAKDKQVIFTYTNDPKSARTNFLGFATGPDSTGIWTFVETYGIIDSSNICVFPN